MSYGTAAQLFSFFLGVSLGLALIFIYYVAFYRPYNKRLEKHQEAQEKEKVENNKHEKIEKDTITQKYFNNMIEFISNKDATTISVTEEGKGILKQYGTIEEILGFTKGIISGLSFESERLTINGLRLTSLEKPESFRWLMYHCVLQAQRIIANERLKKAEEQHKIDCENYEAVKELLEDNDGVEESKE